MFIRSLRYTSNNACRHHRYCRCTGQIFPVCSAATLQRPWETPSLNPATAARSGVDARLRGAARRAGMAHTLANLVAIRSDQTARSECAPEVKPPRGRARFARIVPSRRPCATRDDRVPCVPTRINHDNPEFRHSRKSRGNSLANIG